jgi:hypothetical protein
LQKPPVKQKRLNGLPTLFSDRSETSIPIDKTRPTSGLKLQSSRLRVAKLQQNEQRNFDRAAMKQTENTSKI